MYSYFNHLLIDYYSIIPWESKRSYLRKRSVKSYVPRIFRTLYEYLLTNYLQFGSKGFFAYGLEEDPYEEVIPDKELHFWQKHGTKRTAGVPAEVPEDKAKKLSKSQKQAYDMDACFSRIGFKVGFAGLIRLIPGVGDIIMLVVNVAIAHQLFSVDRYSYSTYPKMVLNLVFDFLVGLIPFIGDLIAISYRADTRNFVMARDNLIKKYVKEVAAAQKSLTAEPHVAQNPVPAKPAATS